MYICILYLYLSDPYVKNKTLPKKSPVRDSTRISDLLTVSGSAKKQGTN